MRISIFIAHPSAAGRISRVTRREDTNRYYRCFGPVYVLNSEPGTVEYARFRRLGPVSPPCCAPAADGPDRCCEKTGGCEGAAALYVGALEELRAGCAGRSGGPP